MTDISSARCRGVRAGVPAFLATAVLATLALLTLAASSALANADGDAALAGSTAAHAAADGLTGKQLDRKRWRKFDRARRAALRKRNSDLRRQGLTLLTDQQIRERVLLQSLGAPVSLANANVVGVASETGNIAINRSGAPVSAPTQSELALAERSSGPTSDDIGQSERGTKGEWSEPVQPNYQSYPGCDNCGPSNATTFPNPQFNDNSRSFAGDPIINTALDYTEPGANARYWSPNPRIVPIYAAMLPNGKVLYWDWYFSGNMTDYDQEVEQKKGTRVLLWDPANPNDPGIRKDLPGANVFCAGFSQLPNGDLLLAGGNADVGLTGLDSTFVYRWRTGTWDKSSNMERTRWYPSVAATWNGESMIVGGDPPEENGQYAQGGNAVPEIFMSNYESPETQVWDSTSPSPRIRKLGALDFPYDDPRNTARVPGWRLYPFLFPWVDGRMLYAGRETEILTIDQRIKGGIDSPDCVHPAPPAEVTYPDNCNDGGDRYVTERDDGQNNGGRQIQRTYGTGAYYGLGKVLVAGGDDDKRYTFSVPASLKGPGFDTYVDGDPQIDEPDAGANWVCQGFANGNQYAYSGNPYAANATSRWTGDAALVHVWNRDWCIGENTPVAGDDNAAVNGASKEVSKIGMRTTEDVSVSPANSKGWPTTEQAQSMNYPRRMAGLTVLPDGKLISTGGMSTTNAADQPASPGEESPNDTALPKQYAMNANNANVNSQLVNYDRAVFASEQWDPDTGTWTVMDSAHRPRQYHSTTILLADGRVMSGGGGVCSTCTYAQYSEANFEYFKPPYFFWADGVEKTPAQRPAITGPFHTEGTGANANEKILPQVDYDGTLNVTYTRAQGESSGTVPITKAALVKLGDPTHGFDQGQRYVPVELTVESPTTAAVKAPPNPYEAPPGFYWLFLLDQNGTPSIARVVQVGANLALKNKRRSSVAYAEQEFADPYSADFGSSQDFGLGTYYASRGNLASVRDNSISSLKIDPGFRARLCRGENLSDAANCITIPSGDYGDLGTRWEDHISSLRIEEGAYDNPANQAAVQDNSADETAPTITVTSPLPGSSVSVATATLNFTVTDDVSENDDGTPIACEQTAGSTLALNVGVNNFVVACTDDAGNVATLPFQVTRNGIDTTPPTIAITAPADDITTDADQVTLEYTVTDNVADTPVCDKASSSRIPLAIGLNTITVSCRDAANNLGSASVHATYIPPASIGNGKARFKLAKSLKITTKLKFKGLCPERCLVTIGITGSGVSVWPKGITLRASSKLQTVTFRLKKSDLRLINGRLKNKRPVRVRLWIDDRIQGASKLKR